jgi:hypothetical protein
MTVSVVIAPDAWFVGLLWERRSRALFIVIVPLIAIRIAFAGRLEHRS